ncbi:oxygenase MpaB family protein [Alcanivorax sp. 1008]|uniref:oxygenase MpaB family protein n=1 Tax=Alcanivorax sp. 1008 TaxID=2816853 RepID=UPI001D88E32B|nr:oxygenase MpaB family protein [Alcanivorax sp. 1008]MCC1496965.1 DUF2236 domain-containing protein [Alcanivorax sp. 1008]
MTRSQQTRARIRPHKDYGLFGPDSITWRVFRFAGSVTLGFQRTVVVEMFEPFLLASVDHTEAVMNRPAVRYDRTLQYVSTIAFHDSSSAVTAADTLMKIHSRIRGIEPLSGLEYDANQPHAQLWIHLTQWHSVLYVYEKFGPGPLTEAEDRQYWAECREAAKFQSINLDEVPRNRAEMRAYYQRMRPHLCATETTQKTVAHLLGASKFLLEKAPWYLKPVAPVVNEAFRRGTIATLPRWLRELGGIRQSRATDTVMVALMKVTARVVPKGPRTQIGILKMISPNTVPVVGPALLRLAPENPVTVSAKQAWATAGRPLPREQYDHFLATRPVRAAAQAPKDEGEAALLQFG